jgi:hypothetical protein
MTEPNNWMKPPPPIQVKTIIKPAVQSFRFRRYEIRATTRCTKLIQMTAGPKKFGVSHFRKFPLVRLNAVVTVSHYKPLKNACFIASAGDERASYAAVALASLDSCASARNEELRAASRQNLAASGKVVATASACVESRNVAGSTSAFQHASRTCAAGSLRRMRRIVYRICARLPASR